jgi:hypothetical protein
MSLTGSNKTKILEQELKELAARLTAIENKLKVEDILSQKDTSWDVVRKKRNKLLKDSDWTLIPGATIDQLAWAAYRQILRDLPQTFKVTGPKSIKWPQQPSVAGPNSTPVE